MAETYDYLFKLLLVGNSAVGKTNIFLRFAEDYYHDDLMGKRQFMWLQWHRMVNLMVKFVVSTTTRINFVFYNLLKTEAIDTA